MKSHTFDELFEGKEASFEVEVRPEDLDRFAELSGDFSEIHVSSEAAQARGFSDRVGHGLLAGAYISRMAGMELPGQLGLLQTVQMKFHKPFHAGDTLRVHGRVREKHASVRVVVIEVKILRGEEVIATAKIQSGISS